MNRIKFSKQLCLGLASALILASCATTSGQPDVDIPANAVESSYKAKNGDEITEYRVAGQLSMVKVVPVRGVTYYLYDRNGDGLIDKPVDDVPVTHYELFKW